MKKRSNTPIVFFFTGLIFILLFLTTIISNGIIIFGVNSGLITEHPDSPLIPFLIQTGMVSIFVGMILALTLSYFALRPVNQLIHAIHAVSNGCFHTKINLKYPKEFRELSESFNQMTDELCSIEILRSDFINNFSHEFKTPIVSILGFAKLIKKGSLTIEKQAEYLDIIISECKRLSDLSSNVLNLSKIESICVLTGAIPFHVSEQIRESILQLVQKWEQKGITFDLHLEDFQITGRPDLLKQVWVNLIDNAIKFSPAAGKIKIRTYREGTFFCFQICDNGIGMNTKTQEKIFDRFYQGDLSHSTEGNGLGLSLVKKIITLHHGTIHVCSVIDKGSTFTVNLPLQ